MNSDTSINHPFESEKVIIVRAITPLVAKDTTTALERGNSTTNEKVSEIRLTLQTETTEQYPDQNNEKCNRGYPRTIYISIN